MKNYWDAKAVAGFAAFCLLASTASAIDINSYSSSHNDRFSSGYPSAPIANTNSNFIGLGYDWSGVGWNANNSNQSFALLGTRFFLYANHYPPPVGGNINFTQSNGQVKSFTVKSLSGPLITGSDLALGMFENPIPASDNIKSYPILFLGYNTTSSSPYKNPYFQNLLMYGWTARIGRSILKNIVQFSADGDQGYYFDYDFDFTEPDYIQLVNGDSGSPTFITTNTPGEMYLAGDHYAIYKDNSGGVDSFLALELSQISGYMAHYGYLPYVVTPATATWTNDGTANNSWTINGNWSSNQVPADVLTTGIVKSCASVLFDGTLNTIRTVNLDGNQTVTGITYKSATGINPFTIATGTSGVLTIGEAGITNKDDDTQILTCNIALRSSQRWDVGQGGLAVSGLINTGSGYLLLIEGQGNTTLSGTISSSGALAKDGPGTLTLNNSVTNTFTGKIFINGGIIAVARDNLLCAAPVSFTTDQLRLNGGTLQATDTFVFSGNRGITLDNLGGTISVNNGKSLSVGAINYGSYSFTKNGLGTLTISGSQTWGNNSSTNVLSGTLNYQPASTAITSVGASTPSLHIAAGATVNVNAQFHDPFTDNTSLTQHINILNDSLSGLNLTNGFTSVNSITGSGNTTVSGIGTILKSNYIAQNQLTLEAGSKLIINPIGGALGSFNSQSGLTVNQSPSLATGGLNLVPEPATWAMLLLAGLTGIGMIYAQRRFQ